VGDVGAAASAIQLLDSAVATAVDGHQQGLAEASRLVEAGSHRGAVGDAAPRRRDPLGVDHEQRLVAA
jgi:hypothetical protein